MLATLTGNAAPLVSPVLSGSTLRLLDDVVSVTTLKDRLQGFQFVEIEPRAILTPAARDYCRERKIEIVRGPTSLSSNSLVGSQGESGSHPQRLLVAGIPSWIPSITKQLCTKQINVHEMQADDTSVLRTIAAGMRSGHQAAIAIVNLAHATCWQAARDERLRPAVVSSWPELQVVLQEVPVNLLILSAKTWNVPSVCNCARRFVQHLQKQS